MTAGAVGVVVTGQPNGAVPIAAVVAATAVVAEPTKRFSSEGRTVIDVLPRVALAHPPLAALANLARTRATARGPAHAVRGRGAPARPHRDATAVPPSVTAVAQQLLAARSGKDYRLRRAEPSQQRESCQVVPVLLAQKLFLRFREQRRPVLMVEQ